MRDEDIARLQQPFAVPPANLPAALADAVSASVPVARELAQEILSDLDDTQLGIGWWAPHPDFARRILIGDYLYTCCESIETNLVEARIHLFEIEDCWQRESRRVRVVADRHGPRVAHQPPISPLEYLPVVKSDLHLAGFFSAIIAALDCLGASIVGVAALPTEIVRCRIERALKSLRQAASDRTGASKMLSHLDARVGALIETAGPPGWLKWVSDFRNTSLHRARRLQGCQVKPHRPVLGPSGRPLPTKVDLVFHLPRDPARSDIEAFLDRQRKHLLNENGLVTLHGVFKTTQEVLRSVLSELVTVWKVRRSTPNLLTQPRQQWPSIDPLSASFEGYSPGSVPFDVTHYTSNPDLIRRLRAASFFRSPQNRGGDSG